MQELETILNSLIKMGWKPKGREGIIKVECLDDHLEFYNEDGFQFWFDYIYLVSINSGLWQFVVENKLYKKTNTVYEKHFGIGKYKNYYDAFYKYRLLESALIPEEELEKFLLDNIRIDG